MDGLVPSGLVAAGVDVALVVLAVEALVLAAFRLKTGRGLPLVTIALVALSGIGLLVALKTALAGGSPALIAAGLSIGGITHGLDLKQRLGARSSP